MPDKPNILVIWGDDIGIWNLSCYSDGLMGYRTPNIDRIANEGMRFTDSYGEQSCTAGRSSFITGQSVFRTGLTKVGMPGASIGLQAEDPTIAELLKAARLRDRPVRQEPPRRQEQVPADGARLRRVLRQPVPPERRGGSGGPGLPEQGRSRSSRSGSVRAACCTAGRPTRTTRPSSRAGAASASRRSRTPARSPGSAWRRATTSSSPRSDFIKRQHDAGKPFFCWVNTTHMHFRTHTKRGASARPGRWQSPYHDTMIDHDKNVGQLLDLLDQLGIADEHDRHVLDRQRAAHEHLAGRRDDAVPQREEHELGRRVPRAAARALARQDPGGHRLERDRAAPRLAADVPRGRGRARTSSRS